jgi:hypothetical protein
MSNPVGHVTVPCSQWSREESHDAHDWNAPIDGPTHCPGYSEPEEGNPEPAPSPSLAGQVRDLERIIERVREAVGTDEPVSEARRGGYREDVEASASRAEQAEQRAAEAERKLSQHKAAITDALGMDRLRDWDDILNAARGLRKECGFDREASEQEQ